MKEFTYHWTQHLLDDPCLRGKEHTGLCHYPVQPIAVNHRWADEYELSDPSGYEQLVLSNMLDIYDER